MKSISLRPGILGVMLTCVVFGMLAGCMPQPETLTPILTQPGMINTGTPASTPSSPTVITLLTDTPMLTSTPTATLTRTTSPSATFTPTDSCPKRETDLQPGFLSPGTIVFIESEWYRDPDHLYSLSYSDPAIQPFMDDLGPGKFGYFYVSHNGKWLAFTQERQEDQHRIHDLFLTTGNDSKRKTISWDDENWGGLKGWIMDDQQLMILPHYNYHTTRRDELIIFNPFTGQQQHITPSFTYPMGSLLDKWWGITGMSAVYDPTLTRVVYLEDNETMVLWDMENEQELWRFIDPPLMLHEVPTWSPKGNFLVLVDLLQADDTYWVTEESEFQILLVNRDGEEVWRSDPYPYYDEWHTLMWSFKWSPNERYLSFIWMAPEDREQRTFILDTNTMKVLDYCIDGSFPVWSPDSTQFAMMEVIPAQSPEGEETYRNVLVDVEKNIVVQLDEITFRPVAWILNEP